jgi:peptidoglycan/LPS O-acetylase OafA/YrhL
MFIVVPFVHPSEAQTVFARSSPWWAYPLFLQNFLVPAPTNATGPLAVTWSLAIEEQFYLVWPWVVRYCSSAQVRRIAIVVIGASPVLRLLLSFGQVALYTNVFCRLDGLMAGALLALLVRSDSFVPSRGVRQAWVVFLVAVPFAFVTEALQARRIVFSLTALAAAALVYLSLYAEQAGLQRALTNRFIVYTGTISYGLYLLHKIPFDIAQALKLDRYPLLAAPMLLVVCYGVAAISWHLLEKPFLRLKRHFELQAIGLDLRPGLLVARGVKGDGD